MMKARAVYLLLALSLFLVFAGHYSAQATGYDSGLPPPPVGVWQGEVVESSAALTELGGLNALALGAADDPYILYYRPATEQLRWAVKVGDDWQTSPVADVSPDGLEIAVAAGPNGIPHIAYVDADADHLLVGVPQTGTGSLEPLTTAGRNLEMAIGEDNRPQLILIQGGQLVYWTKQHGLWQSEPVNPAGTSVYQAHLALDAQARPHVVWSVDNRQGQHLSVRRGADDWQVETLPFEDVKALDVGPDGTLHLLTAIHWAEPGKPPLSFVRLSLSERTGDEWTSESLSVHSAYGGSDRDGRLLVDDRGGIHLFITQLFDHIEYHQRDEKGHWSHEASWPVNVHYAVALGRDDEPRLSFHAGTDLSFWRRTIVLLDKHALLPMVPR